MSVALVVGGHVDWCDEIDRLEDMIGGRWPGPVVACNDVGCFLPDLDHWVSLHGNKFFGPPRWVEMRGWPLDRRLAALPAIRRARIERFLTDRDATEPLSREFETWSCDNMRELDHHWNRYTGGSSGFYALAVARQALGIDRAVLCGVHMDNEANAFRGAPKWGGNRYHRGWTGKEQDKVTWSRSDIEATVRSMGGLTREWFGEPDAEFLTPFHAWKSETHTPCA